MEEIRENPVRGRFNAAVLRLLDGYAHRALGGHKAPLFAALTGTVVEIGPGTGAVRRSLPPDLDRVVATISSFLTTPG